ncbi:MAG: type II toxin-antitoxin system RelE/ParE family toxin [Candidatus Odinarchaeota archaeon]|nr:type II toxin-antitoxin system RelE/ParE family toxin [Candidatus Odinarchaeota archaeon]
MTFSILIKKSAFKFISQLDKEYKQRIYELIRTIKVAPIPARLFDVTKLKGYKNTYRVRLGKMRIIYEVDWSQNVIIIHFVGYRKKAYK